MSETTNNLTALKLPKAVSVAELAKLTSQSPAKLIAELMKNGVMASINEYVDFETAAILVHEFGFEAVLQTEEDEKRPSDAAALSDEKKPRPPVVVVMGHVDHGKTTLLDKLRESDVAGSEAGGITQHIGAYQVKKNDRLITFLDTPGHEAFSALRAHGARMTDVAIIVVAADDGVKPQTKEAITLAKTAKTPIIVAINKIDKTGADVSRVKQELSENDVLADDWGGDVPFVEISAKNGDGLDKLLEMILLVADIASPEARFDGLARGMVIEAHTESGRGVVATVLVQEGTLAMGDYIIAGSNYGKVRSLTDEHGHPTKTATPSTPAVVLGLKTIPDFGDWFEVVPSEKVARDWVANRDKKVNVKSLMHTKSSTAADLVAAVEDGKVKELAVVLKTDVAGSLESLTTSLESIGNDEVRVRIISSGQGDISENDVNTAAAGGALILGFNVGISAAINQLAKRSSVEFKLYRVIYELLDDVHDWLSALLPPEVIEHDAATLEVLGIFKVAKDQIVTGGKVLSGKIIPNLDVKVVREGKEIGRAKLLSLQKNKDNVKEVVQGDECGLVLSNFGELKLNDELHFFTTEEKARRI